MNKLLEVKITSLNESRAVLTLTDGQSITIEANKLPSKAQLGETLYLYLSAVNLSSDQELTKLILNELLNANEQAPQAA